MNYYVVNYLVFDNRRIVENNWTAVSLHNFANIDDFRNTIAKMKNMHKNAASIVIKSYKQVSLEEYNRENNIAV